MTKNTSGSFNKSVILQEKVLPHLSSAILLLSTVEHSYCLGCQSGIVWLIGRDPPDESHGSQTIGMTVSVHLHWKFQVKFVEPALSHMSVKW